MNIKYMTDYLREKRGPNDVLYQRIKAQTIGNDACDSIAQGILMTLDSIRELSNDSRQVNGSLRLVDCVLRDAERLALSQLGLEKTIQGTEVPRKA